MDYRIEVLDCEITIVGVKHKVVTREAFAVIPKLWEEAAQTGLLTRCVDMSWEKPQRRLEGVLGVCGNKAAITEAEFSYLMGCRYEGEPPADMEKLVIPKSTWAVFPNVADAWQRVYTEWLPASGYELAALPCIENYVAPDRVPSSELWVPVVSKTS